MWLKVEGEVIRVKKGHEFWLKEDGTNQVMYVISHDYKFLTPGQRISLAESVVKYERLPQLLLC
jgi:hypothetical protein